MIIKVLSPCNNISFTVTQIGLHAYFEKHYTMVSVGLRYFFLLL